MTAADLLWLGSVLLTALGGLILAVGLRLRKPPVLDAEPLVSFRLQLAREAHFSPAQASGLVAALAPHLARPGEPAPWLELHGRAGELVFRLAVQESTVSLLRGQLAAWVPGARLEPEDARTQEPATAVLPLRLRKPDLFPLGPAATVEPDPLLGVVGALTSSDDPCGVRLTWTQAPRDWKSWGPVALQAAKEGRRLPPRGLWLWPWLLLQALLPPKSAPSAPSRSEGKLAGAEAKLQAPVFGGTLSTWATGKTAEMALGRARDLAAQLAIAFSIPGGNPLVPADNSHLVTGPDDRNCPPGPVLALSAAEIGALYHLPPVDASLIARANSRVVPPVAALRRSGGDEASVTLLGEALTRDGPVPFGLSTEERLLHTYVVGKTGTGKSPLLATMLRQDLEAGRGVGLIDPHGDLAERVLTLVPPHRRDDVLYFNPADVEYPVPYNLLAAGSRAERPLLASGAVGVFKKLYGDSWGPRLEHFLRNAVLALLETPAPSLLMLPQLLSDREYRRQVVGYVTDPVVRTFFQAEFESYDPRWRAEAISPILNKVGQFLASPVVRNIVGPPGPGFSLRELMDRGGIFVANLAVGKIGEDNAALLGGLLVAGFQLAAMSRAALPAGERREFYLSVDEFQRFATDAFAAILSEARKYRFGLTLSHQYLDQVPAATLDAVLGNVGSLCVFRVGAPDTARLTKELAPQFTAEDLVHLPNHHFCARLTYGGETLPAFSARTVPLPEGEEGLDTLIKSSRRMWARTRAEVELEIGDMWEGRL